MTDAAGERPAGGLAGIERELAALWRSQSAGDDAVVRACEHNLIVVCAEGGAEVAGASAVVARTVASAPGRAILLVPTDEVRGLNAFVSANCHLAAGGRTVCSEQITLETGPDAAPLVSGSILTLLVGEMPVFTWWRRPALQDDPLLAPLQELSDCWIVDSARLERPADRLKELRRIAARPGWHGHVADIAWMRLDPWREAVAALFDTPAMRAHLDAVERVAVAAGGPAAEGGLTAAGASIAGWLASRLGWTPGDRPRRWRARDGRRVTIELSRESALPAGQVSSVRIESAGQGSRGLFTVRRAGPDADIIVSTVEVRSSCPLPRKVQLPQRDEAALLCGTLQEPVRDRVFEAALEAAAALS